MFKRKKPEAPAVVVPPPPETLASGTEVDVPVVEEIPFCVVIDADGRVRRAGFTTFELAEGQRALFAGRELPAHTEHLPWNASERQVFWNGTSFEDRGPVEPPPAPPPAVDETDPGPDPHAVPPEDE